ncbi:MAG TPA: hypothetical protein VFG77_00470 [Nitrososphaeraceae archaeon]|nr:hypothetical protein [Nitrososphaeraceae archaeon]
MKRKIQGITLVGAIKNIFPEMGTVLYRPRICLHDEFIVKSKDGKHDYFVGIDNSWVNVKYR